MMTTMRRVGASVVAFFVGTMLTGAAQYQGWPIPEGGRDEKSPMSSVAGAAARGKALYRARPVRDRIAPAHFNNQWDNAMTGHDDSKRVWEQNIDSEVAFWRDFIRTRGGKWKDTWDTRMNPDCPLPRYLRDLVVAGADDVIEALDVGCGPPDLPGPDVAMEDRARHCG